METSSSETPPYQIFPAVSGKEARDEGSTNRGDPSLLMPSLSTPSCELAQLSCTSRHVYPAICTACREAKVPNFSQGLARDLFCLGWETAQRQSSFPPSHSPCSVRLVRGAACTSGVCLGGLERGWEGGRPGMISVCVLQLIKSNRAGNTNSEEAEQAGDAAWRGAVLRGSFCSSSPAGGWLWFFPMYSSKLL